MLPKGERQAILMKGNGESFNTASSSSIKQVDSKNVVNDNHNIPMSGEPNSVTQSCVDGNLFRNATMIVTAKPIWILIILIMVIQKHILWYHTNIISLGIMGSRVGAKMRR